MKKKLTCSYLTLFLLLYISLFISMGFFIEAFIGILRQSGVGLENIGFIYLLGLFWVLKFLWAPFMDKISFKNLGHYRAWIMIAQSLMVLTMILISFFDIKENLTLIIILSIFSCLFAASQNVALDAFAYKLTFKKERPIVNSLKVAGGLIGMILGGGIGLVIYAKIGWQYTILSLALLTALPLIQILFFKEPKNKEQDFSQKVDYKQYITFWKTKQKKLWFILLLLYPATVSAAFGMTTPFLVDLGWELDKIGFTVYIVGYSIGFLSSFATSFLVRVFSKKTILIFASFGQIVGILMLLLLFEHHTKEYLVILAVSLIFLFYTPSQVLMNTIMMDLSLSKTPASSFAIQHSLYTCSGVLFSVIAVTMSGIFGYEKIILAFSLIGALTMFLSTKINYIMQNQV